MNSSGSEHGSVHILALTLHHGCWAHDCTKTPKDTGITRHQKIKVSETPGQNGSVAESLIEHAS